MQQTFLVISKEILWLLEKRDAILNREAVVTHILDTLVWQELPGQAVVLL